MKKILGIVLTGLLLASCGSIEKSEKLQIVTTSYALRTFIEEIGGDAVEVVFSLTGNPHHFELTQADAAKISDADIFINTNAGDYVSIGKKIEAVNPKLIISDVIGNIPLLEAEAHDHDHDHDHDDSDHDDHASDEMVNMHLDGIKDGHYHTGDILQLTADTEVEVPYEQMKWLIKRADAAEFTEINGAQQALSLPLTATENGAKIKAVKYDGSNHIVGNSNTYTVDIDDHTGVEGIHNADVFAEAMDPHIWLSPKLSEQLVNNITDALTKQKPEHKDMFAKNGKELQEKLQTLDKKFAEALSTKTKKNILVSHAAYAYLADSYGFNQKGVTSNSDHGENTQQAIVELDEFIKNEDISYLFVENNIQTSSSANVLKEKFNLKELPLYNIETGEHSDTYFELMEKNLESLKKGLAVTIN